MNCCNLNSETLDFDIQVSGKYNPNLHEPLKRSISGKKRDELAGKVMQHGTKKVQNQIVLTKDLTAANCMSESTNRTLACLRKMKSSKLAFADLDSEDCIDLLCHKRLSDLMESSQSDITPPYIQYIRADSFMVALWCYNQIEYLAKEKQKYCILMQQVI